jgi:hypothetical protein
MGARRGGREDSPLAGLLRRSPRQEATPERDQGDGRAAPRDAGVGDKQLGGGPELRPEARRGASGPSKPTQKRRGRPRGGRRSNPAYVQISARIHKDVRFSLERVLAERSEREGRYVEMAEVIEDLMRFYVENGDPYEMLGR